MSEKQRRSQPDDWDMDNSETVAPSSRRRAVVSVALSRDEFELIGESAERARMKTSEFIRAAALEKARASASATDIVITTSLGSRMFARRLPPVTALAQGTGVEFKQISA